MSREQQLLNEERADSAAAAERLQKLRSDAIAGNVELPRASAVLANAFSIVRDSLLVAQQAKVTGVGAKYKNWLRAVPADVLAVISIRTCLQMASEKRLSNKDLTVQQIAIKLGKLFELEVRIKEAEKVNPLYMQKVHDQVKEHNTSSLDHIKRLYNAAYEAVMKGELDTRTTNAEALQLGKFGLQACIDAGLVEVHRSMGSKGDMVAVRLSENVEEFLYNYGDADVAMVVDRLDGCMICPPEPWTNLYDGGFLSTRRKAQYPLMAMHRIRKSERARLRREFTAEKMPEVFAVANYLQSIPMHIHGPTLAAVQAVWESGGGVLGVPMKTPPKAPEHPFAKDWVAASAPEHEQEKHLAWRRQTARYYQERLEWRGKVREIGSFLRTASKHTGPIWFPVFFDSRGRWYYRGFPNPQGSDISKAVLHFHEKKPLGKQGIYWLKVHIANSLGFDKERFDDRVAFTERVWEVLCAALDSPADNAAAFGTDAPWCVFAAAWELREALRSGSPESYCSGVVVHMDATCSGLQHFSALLRDPVGGAYVNLTDPGSGPKQDIYARVSAGALEAAKRDLASSDQKVRSLAQFWLDTGIPRGMAKKPVMTYVYGATLRGTTEFVQDYVETEMNVQWPEGHRIYDVAQYCAQKLFKGIAATVPSADYAMQWLKSIASAQPNGKRMEWRSPSGFLVQHDYQDYDETRVCIRSCGLSRVIVRDYNENTVKSTMRNAIAPNFVHALDATHLTKTALRMLEATLSVVGIHDSFGTHAADVASMHKYIREEFFNMYNNKNLLTEFLWEVEGVGESPMRSTLDLSEVLDSEFFFC